MEQAIFIAALLGLAAFVAVMILGILAAAEKVEQERDQFFRDGAEDHSELREQINDDWPELREHLRQREAKIERE